MEYYTLSEVCEQTNVSRRAIQGYEKAGLVWRIGKNERCYLLYDEASLARIRQIHLYQQFGFSVKEVVTIIDAPNEELKEAVKAKIKLLEKEYAKKKEIIQKAYRLLERL